MTDDTKKTDQVISLAEFQRTKEALENPDNSDDFAPPSDKEIIDTILKMSGEEDFKHIVVIGEKPNGKLAFFSSCSGGRDIVYYCTAFTQLVMDTSFDDMED